MFLLFWQLLFVPLKELYLKLDFEFFQIHDYEWINIIGLKLNDPLAPQNFTDGI